jgi:hypothetical protein
MSPYGILLLSLLCSITVFPQTSVSAYWNMQVLQPNTTGGANFQVSNLLQGNNFGTTVFLNNASSSAGAYPGASGEFNAALACRTGTLIKESGGSAYVSFSLTAAAGFKMSVQSIKVGVRSTLTGPQSLSLYSSADNYAVPLETRPLLANSVWSMVQLSAASLSAKSQLEFRIYGYNGVGTAAINIANWRLDDLQVEGTVIPENLPVQWLYAEIFPQGNSIKVEWSTTVDHTNKGFLIERSTNGLQYDSIGFVEASAAANNLQQRYQFVDASPPFVPLFYTIHQLDKDGKRATSIIRYSTGLSSSTAEENISRVHVQKQQVEFYSTVAAPAVVYLYTADGKLLAQQRVTVHTNTSMPQQISLPFSTLKSGIYILAIQQLNKRWTKKIVINGW